MSAKKAIDQFLVIQNSTSVRSQLIYPLIRAMSVQFGSSNNIQLITPEGNRDEKERKIHCREVKIKGNLGDTV